MSAPEDKDAPPLDTIAGIMHAIRQINEQGARERKAAEPCPGSDVRHYRNGSVDVTTCELQRGHDGPCRRGKKRWIDG